ncbi:hypothetical protein G647_03006 [Cladophialophora carrionii CBS 160.54]|uniref:Uncharacterized protein n=1 Tax=Cladophialophora carrionii CBS 160.54 TaxID=1279043 RepID=V9DH58_9EURO|nr:uncharacterized protein G647_03006 [Cladophialophora carrionii CBS 160.54]ETI26229.1 hypothetical protein G647_03006 [Cladophialophora carrionii CBS 160.54]
MTPAVPTATKNPGQDGTNFVDDPLNQIYIDHGAKHNRGATIGASTTDTRVTAQHHTRNPSRPARNQRHVAPSDEGIGDRKLRVSKWSDKLADYDSHLLERIPIVIVEVTAADELEIEGLSTRRSGQHGPVQEDQLLVRGLFEDSTRIPSWGFHILATHLRIIPAPLLGITRIINIESTLTLAGIDENWTELIAGIVDVTKRTYTLHRGLLSAVGVDDSQEDGHSAVYAPSPPPAPASSLGYMSEGDFGQPQHHEARSQMSRRQHSRTQSYEEEESEVEVLRPGDELTVIERHGPVDGDYEWYDDGGIRVRVREISR